MIVALDFKKK